MFLSEIADVAIIFFIIMDPFSSVLPFLAVTKNAGVKERVRLAGVATITAGIVLVTFTLIGPEMLRILAVRVESFQIAGGLLLLLIGIAFVFGLHFEDNSRRKKEITSEVLLIGVPLICGPGTMTTALLFSASHGVLVTLMGGIAACIVVYVVLMAANPIAQLVGVRGLEISSRLIGIIVSAVGVEYIRLGFGF
ncbi:MAG: MarC family protein [Candidatus Anstonellales archaeon]